jgi:hypothetical protein
MMSCTLARTTFSLAVRSSTLRAMLWNRSLSRPEISERSPVRSRVFARICETVSPFSVTT